MRHDLLYPDGEMSVKSQLIILCMFAIEVRAMQKMLPISESEKQATIAAIERSKIHLPEVHNPPAPRLVEARIRVADFIQRYNAEFVYGRIDKMNIADSKN